MSIEKLSQNIKYFRKKNKLSQDKLARLSNTPYNTLVKIESCKIKNPSVFTISKIAHAFGISLDQLVGSKTK